MALHDVDNSPNRENPMPNTHDTSFVENFPIINKPRDAHGTNASNVVTDASAASSVSAMKNGDFRLALSGTATLDATSTTAGTPIINTIAHGLSYIPVPVVVVFDTTNGVYTPLPYADGLSPSGGFMNMNNWIFCSTDATNLYIFFFPGTSSNWGTWTFRYYLFQQTAN